MAHLIQGRKLAVPNALLHEAAWAFASALMGRGFFDTRPIAVSSILSRVGSISGKGTFVASNREFDFVELRARILPFLEQLENPDLLPPWPGPDDRASFILDCFRNETIFARTCAGYSAALRAYAEVVGAWFPKFRFDLELARQMPLKVVGVVSVINRNGAERDRFSAISYTTEPNPGPIPVSLDLRWAEEDEYKRFQQEIRGAAKNLTSSIVDDVLSTDPGSRLMYKWLTSELRELSWLQ